MTNKDYKLDISWEEWRRFLEEAEFPELARGLKPEEPKYYPRFSVIKSEENKPYSQNNESQKRDI